MTELLGSIISGVIGGVIVIVVQFIFDHKKEMSIRLHSIKEDKYRSLLIFMACSLDINKKKYFSLNEQQEIKSEQEYLEEITEYYYHSVLYSSDNVLLAIKTFIRDPNKINYINVAKEMRKELWGKKTKIKLSEIMIENKIA